MREVSSAGVNEDEVSRTLDVGAPSVPFGAEPDVLDGHWAPEVALDPKHRPQRWNEPASTVRREWWRWPQEAHVVNEAGTMYRRFSVAEIAVLQGFDPQWFEAAGVGSTDRVRAIGDAVPPPLAEAVVASVDEAWTWHNRTAIEVCAGSGGLALGAVRAAELDHLLLVDRWAPACEILRADKPWPATRVVHGDVKATNLARYRGKVGLLSGGPPCQPWSQAGAHGGFEDPRDLLGSIHELVDTLRPEVFVFENVPGLTTDQNAEYLQTVLNRLRCPTAKGRVRYGVAAGIVNAADFGLPQKRRRLFVVGGRDVPNAWAYGVLDRLFGRISHYNPRALRQGKAHWVTVGQAIGGMADPGGWRSWRYEGHDGAIVGFARRK